VRKSRTKTRTEVSSSKQRQENQENERQTGVSKTKADQIKSVQAIDLERKLGTQNEDQLGSKSTNTD
jgi:hypothetical protein